MTIPVDPNESSPTSKGPNHAVKIINSPHMRTGALLLLAICIPYNIYLQRNLSNEKVLRNHEFGHTSVSSPLLSNEDVAGYVPAMVEDYIVTHSKELGYESTDPEEARGCDIWKHPEKSSNEVFSFLHLYKRNLYNYADTMKHYQSVNLNLMKTMKENDGLRNWGEVCKGLRPTPGGLKSLFPSNQLSFLQKQGFLEPLLTPLRHPDYCDFDQNRNSVITLDYLVHDFEAMCIKLKPHSKLILIDAGASLEFHGERQIPLVNLIDTYNKFGFYFDHIYAFEVKPTDPERLYNELLPKDYIPSYHWINTGMSYRVGFANFHNVMYIH